MADRRGRRILLLLIGVLATAGMIALAPPAQAAPAYPSSMAALGDSITRAYDVCCSYGDHPAQSWSTGDGASDGITSQYEHLRALNPAISGHAANLAVTGAMMKDGVNQAGGVSGAQYVTILLGANDICTRTIGGMTPTGDFAREFGDTLDQVHRSSPNALVFVSSIPNIYKLWQALRWNPLAEAVWAAAKICQSMLAVTNTESQRQQVLRHEGELNGVLASICTDPDHTAYCKWDGYATFNTSFSSSQVSTLDYFHPNKSGQALLANKTWAASYWG